MIIEGWLSPRVKMPGYNHIQYFLRMLLQPTTECHLQNIRLFFSDAGCSDPRDRIFAVLSLLDKTSRQICSTPDYTKEAAVIYQGITLRFMKTSNNLSILNQCEHLAHSQAVPAPSWVPAWSVPVTSAMAEKLVYASAQLSASFLFKEPNILEVAGKSITRVERLSCFPGLLEFDNMDAREGWDAIRTIIKSNPCFACPGYRTGISTEEAFTRIAFQYNFQDFHDPPWLRNATLSENWALLKRMLKNTEYQDTDCAFYIKLRWAVAGNYLFSCEGGYIGMATCPVEVGDEVCVVLGCDAPLLLRPVRQDEYLVIGPCRVEGLLFGEALLGPLPRNIRPRFKSHESPQVWSWGFVDDTTGRFFERGSPA